MDVREELHLDLSPEVAAWACREAVVALDWPLLESLEPDRLVLKKGLRFGTGSLSRIEVRWAAAPEGTDVTLTGHDAWAFGRWERRTLQSLINTVRNAIEVAARRTADA